MRKTVSHAVVINAVEPLISVKVSRQRLQELLRPIKGVIYDKDNLMVNSDPLHEVAWNSVLETLGPLRYNDVPQNIQSAWVGRREVEVAGIIVKELGLEIASEEFLRRKSLAFNELSRTKLEALPGLNESLVFFQNLGFRIGMATSGTRDQVELVNSRFDVGRFFDVQLCSEDVKIGKPDPEIYIKTAKALELEPVQCVVLEDADSGIEAGVRAGCFTIGIENSYTPPQRRDGAHLILPSLLEVVNLPFMAITEQKR